MLSKELCEGIIKRWTGGEVKDPRADRDALEELVACICFDGDLEVASKQIDTWREQAIKDPHHHR